MKDSEGKSNPQTLDDNNKLKKEVRTEVLLYLKIFITTNNYEDKTYYLACLYFDTIVSTSFYQKFKKEVKLDLVATSCVLLASKFIENDPLVPNLRGIQAINSTNLYNIKEIRKYEELCIKLLHYKLDLIIAYDYISIFFKIGIFLIEEKPNMKTSTDIDNDVIYKQCLGILSEFVMDARFTEFSQMEVAFACIGLVREAEKLSPWNDVFANIYDVNFEDFKNCYELLKKRNKKFFAPKLMTYKKELNLNLNLNLNSLDVDNLPLTLFKNRNTLSLLTVPNTSREKKMKSFEFLFSQNFQNKIDHNTNQLKEKINSKDKEKSLTSKILLNIFVK